MVAEAHGSTVAHGPQYPEFFEYQQSGVINFQPRNQDRIEFRDKSIYLPGMILHQPALGNAYFGLNSHYPGHPWCAKCDQYGIGPASDIGNHLKPKGAFTWVSTSYAAPLVHTLAELTEVERTSEEHTFRSQLGAQESARYIDIRRSPSEVWYNANHQLGSSSVPPGGLEDVSPLLDYRRGINIKYVVNGKERGIQQATRTSMYTN
ncbi:hypothetical protein BD779DRAFT_1469035 [Infundibulicybe gibba]|nr:hypothetical protein BD779DRAFT_1469035 [Infundibulicybe gibba]